MRGLEWRYGGGKVDILNPLLLSSLSRGSGNISVTDSDAESGRDGVASSTTSSTNGVSKASMAAGEVTVVDWSAGSWRESMGRISWWCVEGVVALLAVRCWWRLVCDEWEERCDSGAVVESKWICGGVLEGIVTDRESSSPIFFLIV